MNVVFFGEYLNGEEEITRFLLLLLRVNEDKAVIKYNKLKSGVNQYINLRYGCKPIQNRLEADTMLFLLKDMLLFPKIDIESMSSSP
jgi:hypothetical protein